MFLALRDVAHAKGRFALIGGVMALITLLVVILTGLGAGLARESVAAITTLSDRDVSQVVFSTPPAGQKVGYDSSRVAAKDVERIAATRGVEETTSLTIAQARAGVNGVPSTVTVFVVPEGSFAAPKGVSKGSVVAGSGLTKDAEVSGGSSISFGDKKVRLASLSDNASYQHMPVVWMTQHDAEQAGIVAAPGASGSAGGAAQNASSVALVKTGSGFDASALAKDAGLQAKTPSDSLSTLSSYTAENGSLTLMRVMLMLVSSLVVGAFFTVWTIQRTPDLAVLKAIGARTGYLVRDALGQAALLLLVGGGIGTLIATVAGMFAKGSVPFVLNLTTTLVPLGLLVALGLVGALVSLRRIVTVDPNSALGAAR